MGMLKPWNSGEENDCLDHLRVKMSRPQPCSKQHASLSAAASFLMATRGRQSCKVQILHRVPLKSVNKPSCSCSLRLLIYACGCN